jgi:hypothetical protein
MLLRPLQIAFEIPSAQLELRELPGQSRYNRVLEPAVAAGCAASSAFRQV